MDYGLKTYERTEKGDEEKNISLTQAEGRRVKEFSTTQ